MSHLILLAALSAYAVGLLRVLRRVGIGPAATATSAVATVAFVWGLLHLVYVSDVLFSLGIVDMPASVVATDTSFGWLLRYAGVNGWVMGIAYYVPLWFVAALIRLLSPARPRASTTAGGAG